MSQFDAWSSRAHFSASSVTRLGFGEEHWKRDPSLYEAYEPLRERLSKLGRKPKRSDVVWHLTGHLLEDVLVAAGGVEVAVERIRAAVRDLQAYIAASNLVAQAGVPFTVSHASAQTAWFALCDLLTWSRTVVERMERPAGDRKRFGKQGLLPAIRPKRLQQRCATLLDTLRSGPVGQSRHLSNFILHTSLVRHPHTGVELTPDGRVVLPVPDVPATKVSHWYLLHWTKERDGLLLAEDIWSAITQFIDDLLCAFEKATPKRLRRVTN